MMYETTPGEAFWFPASNFSQQSEPFTEYNEHAGVRGRALLCLLLQNKWLKVMVIRKKKKKKKNKKTDFA